MAHNLIARARTDTVPVTVLRTDGYDAWRKQQPQSRQDWLKQVSFSATAGDSTVLPPAEGRSAGAVFIVGGDGDLWNWAGLATQLPPGSYRLDGKLPVALASEAALGWGMTGYEFTAYRKSRETPRQLVWPANANREAVIRQLDAATLVRDLINTPAEDMGPTELAAAARKLGRAHGAKVGVIVGDALLKANWPMIHMVGRASDDAPRLIDLRWGTRGPRVTLVGKGVCFDTGGLDIKPAAGMLRMKKDMGGAAHVLGLASMIMAAKLPVRLRVLIGAVENAIAGNAYRPWDVLKTRKGITVENQNTDAEGRLVIGDCLYEASCEKPDRRRRRACRALLQQRQAGRRPRPPWRGNGRPDVASAALYALPAHDRLQGRRRIERQRRTVRRRHYGGAVPQRIRRERRALGAFRHHGVEHDEPAGPAGGRGDAGYARGLRADRGTFRQTE